MKTIKRQEKHSEANIFMLQKNLVKMLAEDILKVMEAVGSVALRLALEEKEGPFGFNKKDEETND